MKKFLLRCACGADITVGPGQAGDRTVCPACGRGADVPKLRELERLPELAAAAVTARPTWGPFHAVALVAAVIAVGSWVAAAIVTRSSPSGAVDLDSFRGAVMAADEVHVYSVWKRGTYASVQRPPSREEEKFLQQSRFTGGVTRALNLLGSLAALTALVAGGTVLAGRGPAAHAAPPVRTSREGQVVNETPDR